MTVAKGIDKSLTQRIIRHFKLFLPFQTMIGDSTTERKMFKTECNSGI